MVLARVLEWARVPGWVVGVEPGLGLGPGPVLVAGLVTVQDPVLDLVRGSERMALVVVGLVVVRLAVPLVSTIQGRSPSCVTGSEHTDRPSFDPRN